MQYLRKISKIKALQEIKNGKADGNGMITEAILRM